MTTNTPELKGCPFCGETKIYSIPKKQDRYSAILCSNSNCGVNMLISYEIDGINAWNTRAGETTWQTIESAPRDGSYVLTGKVGMRNPEIASFRYGCWDIFDREDIEYRPTHWMPLPLPPTGEKK